MRKGERTKQDIITAAAAMFAANGYAGTAIQDILDQLGCSKGAFYHHFDTKFDVLLAITHARAQDARTRYQAASPLYPMEALNALLKEASFLTPESLPLIKSLSTLTGTYEGFAMLSVMQEDITTQFFTQFATIMASLGRAEEALFTDLPTLRLVFSGFLAGCVQIIASLYQQSQASQPDESLALLQALRRHLENALGLPPGCLVILEYDELRRFAAALRP